MFARYSTFVHPIVFAGTANSYEHFPYLWFRNKTEGRTYYRSSRLYFLVFLIGSA